MVPAAVVAYQSGSSRDRSAVGLLGVAAACLAGQHFGLMPQLVQRARDVQAGEAARADHDGHKVALPPSKVHVVYVGLEGVKLVCALAAGVMLLQQARVEYRL